MMLFNINNYVIYLMWSAANSMRNFLEDLGTMNQAVEILKEPIEIKDGKKNLNVTKGEIKFENVKFAYDKNEPIFTEKSIIIKPGEKVGLVGHSGSGKSTFISLILRLFDVENGKILIDNQDISKVKKESLRKSIGVIPQDSSLLHRNLFENIAYGQNKIDKDKVIEAAKNAHAHEFINELPEKYRSLVGERGIKLSGGQRQRIAIARAFVKNAPILILDEATSALDSITENLIQESFKKLMKDKTTLVVAHRLSTLRIMDRILVFDKGKIIEDGTHKELMDLKGVYAKLWNSQVNGVLTKEVESPSALPLWKV
jgi:ATP-binding cassette subfamily B protein